MDSDDDEPRPVKVKYDPLASEKLKNLRAYLDSMPCEVKDESPSSDHDTEKEDNDESHDEPSRSRRAKDEDGDGPFDGKDGGGEGEDDEEYVVDLKPEVWTGDVKWPQLDNPPFSSEDVALVLSESKDGTTVQVPAHIAKYLRTYQREGVRFLYDKYSQDTGCILGDDMGLGKTTQTTAFLIAILGKHGTSADICTTTEHARKQGKKRPVLICCPASIMNQWMSELLVWSFFHVRICAGPNKDAIVDMALQGEIEIIILSFETYRVMSGRLNPVDWEVVIFDEAHKVKNIKSQLSQAANCLKCKRRVGLTGTLLQNQMKELHCTLSWAVPGSLGIDKHFDEEYAQPIKQGQKRDATEYQIIKARSLAKHLKELINRHVLRRDKRMIADQVPGKEDVIVVCPMSQAQQDVYRRVVNSHDYVLMRDSEVPCQCGSGEKRGKCCYKFVALDEVECFDTRDIRDQKDAFGMPMTCVKWSYFMLVAIVQACKVGNHLDLVRVCPRDPKLKQEKDRMFAKVAFGTDDPDVIEQNDKLVSMSDDTDCGKMQVMKRLLAKFYKQNDKVLIFSYSVRMLDILEKFMVRIGHTYLRLDGSTPPSKRLKIVNDYNGSNDWFVMLLSTRAGSLGINLTSANVVVIMDPSWNPTHDLQAQDRAFRIGQRRHVKVYRLLSAGSMEEIIYQRQVYKQQLVNISMEASHERRHFVGVQGNPDDKGELWGAVNLFKWREPSHGSVDSGRLIEKRDARNVSTVGGAKVGRGSAGGTGSDDEDEDAAWQTAVRDVIDELDEGDSGARKRGKDAKGESHMSVGDILDNASLLTINHSSVVGHSEAEAEANQRIKKLKRSVSVGAPDLLAGRKNRNKGVGKSISLGKNPAVDPSPGRDVDAGDGIGRGDKRQRLDDDAGGSSSNGGSRQDTATTSGGGGGEGVEGGSSRSARRGAYDERCKVDFKCDFKTLLILLIKADAASCQKVCGCSWDDLLNSDADEERISEMVKAIIIYQGESGL